jgi:hypothetical protein
MSDMLSFSFPSSYAITLAKDGRSFTLETPGLRLAGCRIGVASDQKQEFARGLALTPRSRNRVTISAASGHGPLTLDIRTAKVGSDAALTFSLALAPNASYRWVELAPLAGLRLTRASHLFSHGRSMGGCHLWPLPAERAENSFESHFQCVVSFAKAKLHLSHPLRQKHISSIRGEVDGQTIADLQAVTRLEFPGGKKLVAEPLTLATVTDGFGALTAWGDAQASVPPPTEPQPVGWNSWDYYRWTITEDEVLANAEFIAADPVLSRHVKRIIVDDGWQYCYGEWEPNSNFPGGMASLAKRLRKMGFEPGLWLCPTAAEPHSRIAQWNTEMLARSEGGDPCLCFECMRRYGFIIDPTRDDSKRWLHDLFKRYADMGFGYFKLDFLAQTLHAPRFHRNVPRGQIMREIITPIHEAVKGRATLMGCGYVYDGGNDMIQITRAGSDIHSTWNETCTNAVSVAARFWASNRVWITDPDFAVCRGPDTSKDPDRGRLQCLYVFVMPDETKRGFSPNRLWSEGFDTIRHHEAQVLLSLVIINGGAVNLSDKLPVLNERGLDLIRRTVAAESGGAPLPLDLFSSERPSYWLQPTPKGYRTLLINWSEEPAELSLDLAPHGINATRARDFWTDATVPIKDNRVTATLKPHCCQLLEFKR